jgi:putative spermidine/putrescine transport system substrate-binding protein
MKGWRRKLGGVALTGLVVFLGFAAAGCGGGGGGDGSAEISGLGSSLDDIKQKARDEGQVNLVIWSGYADPAWAKPFTAETGCTVNTKDGASSDDMIDLISTGQYDGV